MLKNGSGFRRLTRSLIRSTECELQVGANGLAVLFQQNGSFFGAICGNQSASIENVRIADQQRLGKTIVELAEQTQRFSSATALKLRTCEIVSDVVTDLGSVRLGMIQCVNGPGVLMIQEVRVSDRQPGQRSRVLSVMFAGVGFNSGIGCGNTVLQKLQCHGFQGG